MSDPIDTGLGQIKDYSLEKLAKQSEKAPKDLHLLTIGELFALRDEIDTLLPPLSLKTLNAEKEVLLQYHRIKALQTEISTTLEGQAGVPANQRAQVANSVAKSLGDITRLRNEIYNGEQFRLMEAALAKALRTLPAEAQTAFYEAYKKTAEDMADVESQGV